MQFEFFAPFLDAETFLNMYEASDDINFGDNEDMLCLGAVCGLDPVGLLDVVNDENQKHTQETVIDLLNDGVTSLDYIYEAQRLSDLGFSNSHLRILSKSSIPAESILAFDLPLIFKSMGFLCEKQIQSWIEQEIDPTSIFSYMTEHESTAENICLFLKFGYSLFDPLVTEYMENNISALEIQAFQNLGISTDIETISSYRYLGINVDEIFSFEKIGIHTIEEIMNYKNTNITAKQLRSFLDIGYSLSDPLIKEFIENDISAEEVNSFTKLDIYTIEAILECKNADITAEKISPFLENGLSLYDPLVFPAIQSGISASELISFVDIGINVIEFILACKESNATPEKISHFLENGFLISDPLLLSSIRFQISAEDLLSFTKIGLNDIEDIKKCKTAHVTAKQVSPFLQHNFSLSNNLIFHAIHLDISAEELLSYTKIGLNTLEEIEICIEGGVTTEEVFPFLQQGFLVSNSLVISAIHSGVSALELSSFTKIGLNNIEDIIACLNANITAEQISPYLEYESLLSNPLLFSAIESGISAHELYSFTAIGLNSIEDIMTCKNANIEAIQISPFLENGFLLSNPLVISAIQSGISTPELISFTTIGVDTIEDIITCKSNNILASQIIPFLENGFSLTNPLVFCAIHSDVSACELFAFLNIGINTIESIMKCKNAYVNAETISPFLEKGFSLSNILVFQSIRFNISAEELYSFTNVGLNTIEDVRLCKDANIMANQISPYIKNGFSCSNSLVFSAIRSFISAEELASFSEIGLQTIENIILCKNENVTAQQISPFLQHEFLLSNPLVLPAIRNGVSALELSSFTNIGLNTLEEILVCKNANVTADQIFPFLEKGFLLSTPLVFPAIQFGISPLELSSFTTIGLNTIEDIMKCKNENITATQIYPFFENGFLFSDPIVFQAIHSGISAPALVSFTKINVSTIEEILKCKNADVSPDELFIFLQNGFLLSNPLVLPAIQSEISAKELSSFLIAGLDTIETIISCKNDNISPTQIAPFLKSGFLLPNTLVFAAIHLNINALELSSFTNIGINTIEDIENCRNAYVTAEDICPFLEHGFLPSNALVFSAIRFQISPEELSSFTTIGLDVMEHILFCKDFGITPQQIIPYVENGFSSSNILVFRAINSKISPEELTSFTTIGLHSIEDIMICKKINITAQQISPFVQHEFLPSHPLVFPAIFSNISATELASFTKIGFKKIEDIIFCKKIRITAEEIFPFLESNLSISNALIFSSILAGISAPELVSFTSIGLTKIEEIIRCKNENINAKQISPFLQEEFSSFMKIGVNTIEKITECKNENISAKEISPFFENGFLFSNPLIFAAIRAGISAQEVVLFNQIGVNTISDMKEYKNRNIAPEKIISFVEIGFSPFDPLVFKYIEHEISAQEVISFSKLDICGIEQIKTYKKKGINSEEILALKKFYSQKDSSVVKYFLTILGLILVPLLLILNHFDKKV